MEGGLEDGLPYLWDADRFHVVLEHFQPALNPPAGEWQLLAEYDGWPNGLALCADGCLAIADHKRGLLRLDPARGAIEPLLARRRREAFKGLNDLVVSRAGDLYFIDQGDTGLHDPTGRLCRLRPDGRLDTLLASVPAPTAWP